MTNTKMAKTVSPQDKVESLINRHFPKPIKVVLTFKPETLRWQDYEQKIGYQFAALEAAVKTDPPKDVIATFKPVGRKMTGYLGFPRGWEESFSFESRDFKGGVYYDTVASVRRA